MRNCLCSVIIWLLGKLEFIYFVFVPSVVLDSFFGFQVTKQTDPIHTSIYILSHGMKSSHSEPCFSSINEDVTVFRL